jgi:type VI secretion system protein VasJ
MAYSDELLTRYLSLVTKPVSEGSAAGEDARFSDEFEALEQELAKTQSMHGAGPIDWVHVVQLSQVILQTLSKDVRVTCWLSWALYQTESFAGLLAGCGMVSYLCRDRWEDVFPRRIGTRSAALGWFASRLEQALSIDVPAKEQLPLFRELERYLCEIDEALSVKLKDEAPLLLPLRRRLAAMIKNAEQGETAPAGIVAQVKQVAANLFASPTVIDTEKDARAAVRAQQDSARPLCAWWLRNKASDARALRLSRAVTWLAVERLPDSNGEQVTQVAGPAESDLKGYAERFERGHYADLVAELEATLGWAPFWFDGQRMVWECLQALNAEAAMHELEVQFAVFLFRLPGITQLRFQGGRPFADATTLRWIESRVAPRLAVEREPEPRRVDESAQLPPWEVVLEEQLPLVHRDGIKSVVQVFKHSIDTAPGDRAKFHWRLTLSRLFHLAKNYELAKNQLEVLEEQLRTSGLAEWEPELYLDVLRLLYNCCELLPQNKVVREYKEDLYRRLCHMDVEAVL